MSSSLSKFDNNIYLEKGFSLIEIVIVLSVLTTLSAISVPVILRSIKLSKLDEAKILMDSYAAECLQEFRLGNDLSNTSPNTYSEKKLKVLGFKKSDSSNCEKFSLNPIDSQDGLLFQFDFRIGAESGTLIKTATPPSDTNSLNSCELWGGDLCTSNQSLKTNWDNQFATEKNKADCESNFFNWRNTQPSGSKNRWDDSSNTCTKKTWVHKTFIAESESEYQEIKSSESCSTAKRSYSSYSGAKYIPECQKTFYFHEGVDMVTEDRMQMEIIEDNEINCAVKREKKRTTVANGKYAGEVSSGKCGNYYWICNKKILTSLDQWKESDCYVP